MRWLKAVAAGLSLLVSGVASSFEFNSNYYAVYEGPLRSDGCRNIYVVPKPSLLIVAVNIPTPIQFMPQTTGYRSDLCSGGSFSPWEKVALTASNMAGLGAVLSGYKLFEGDFDGDGKRDFFLQGNDTVRSSVILTTNASGVPQVYKNFYGWVNSAYLPQVTTIDADRNGRTDIVATDINGNTITLFGNNENDFTPADTGSGGSTFNVNLVGSINGKFRVDEGGAATYGVGIFAGSGTAGAVPRISLNYSSNDADGVAGTGWSIGGLSSITRCRQTMAQDGAVSAISLTASDRFCLDGQRLILTAGTYGAEGSTYRTEIDSYAVVTVVNSSGAAVGNPRGFKVVRKDGSTSYYGAYYFSVGADAQHVVDGTKVLTWAIAHTADSVGNGIRYQYTLDTSANEHLIDRIDFAYGSSPGTTTNSSTYIKFNYKLRADVSRGYIAGVKVSQTKRLVSIQSFSSGVELRSYHLVYRANSTSNRSFVEKLFECVGSNCLSPTTFNWKLNQGGFGGGTSVATVSGTAAITTVASPDINGDGKSDIVYQSGTHPYPIYYHLSNGNGYGPAISLVTNVNNGGARFLVLDKNNDGKQDILFSNSNSQNVILYLGGASGLDGGTAMPQLNGATYLTLADFDTDGLPDIFGAVYPGIVLQWMAQRTNVSGQWSVNYVQSQNFLMPSGNIPPTPPECGNPPGSAYIAATQLGSMADVDGDGRVDMPAIAKYGTVCQSSYVTFFVGDAAGNYVSRDWVRGEWVAADDMNGDGLADQWYNDINNNRAVRFSTGTTFTPPLVLGAKATYENSFFVDYNADGYGDLMLPSAGVLVAQPFNPSTQTYSAAVTVSALPFQVASGTVSADRYLPVDIDGDGHADLLRINNSASGNTITLYKSADVGSAGNRIVGIDNGLGNNTTLTYKPLTDPAVYTKGADANSVTGWREAPVFDVAPATYVVASVSSTAPTAHATTGGAVNYGAKNVTSYQYGGQKLQAGGRGALGFSWIKTKDEQTNIASVTWYSQVFPFTGQPFWTLVQSGGGVGIKSIVNTLNQTVRNGVGSAKYYQVYTTNIKEQANDPVSGAETSYVVTDIVAPDEWGNVTNFGYAPGIMATVYQSDHTTVVKQVGTYNALGTSAYDQQFGRLTATTVAYIRPGTDNILRTTNFSYYGEGDGNLRGLLKTESTSSGDGAPTAVTTYQYDAFGNKNRITQSAGGSERYTATTYDTDGRFVAARSSEFYDGSAWIPRTIESIVSRNAYGQPTQVQGLNGLVTYSSYDALGREMSRGDNTGAALTTQYLWGGASGAQYQIQTIASTGATAAEYFDALGRTILKGHVGFDGRWVYAETEYDNVGRVKRQALPHYSGDMTYWEVNNYDAFRLQSQTVPVTGGGSASRSITYAGLTKTVTNVLGQSQIEVRNPAGELVSVTDHLGGEVSYLYDSAGQVITTTNKGTQNGALVTMNTVLQYDQLGRKTKMIDSDKGTWFYQYNGFGEMVAQYKVMSTSTYSDGLSTALGASVPMQRTEMTYDRRGRMTGRADYRENGALESLSKWEYDTAENGLGQLATDYIDGQTIGHMYGYDAYGRPSASMLVVDGWYGEETLYDQYGRVATQVDALSSGSGTQNNYNGYGYLYSVSDLATGTELYRVQNMDAADNVTTALLGNGATATWNYDAASGLLLNQTVVVGATTLQNVSYTWDALGNQKSRWDHGLQHPSGTKNVRQSFCYDGLNRLLKTHQGTLSGSCSLTPAQQDQEYDSFGGITRKNDVGTYTYNNQRPHQLQSTSDGVTYSYDTVGNMTADSSGRALGYTVFDKPSSIGKSTDQVTFKHGVDREMVKRVDVGSGGPATTYYLGNVEKVVKADGSYDMKRYIAGVALWTHHFNSSDVETGVDKRYLHKDVLGSVVMITNSVGASLQQFAYNPWGRRVSVSDETATVPGTSFLPVTAQLTTHGFTGHDMLDAVGLIHMGGRVYDQRLGRFIQADPFVQDTTNLQSFNRYSYVGNNPLSFTDPSGYFGGWLGKKLKSIDRGIRRARDKIVGSVIRALGPELSSAFVAVGSYFCGPAYAACVAAGNYDIAKAYGASTSDALKAGAIAGASAYAFGPADPSSISIQQAASQFAGHTIAAYNPELGQLYNFAAGGITNGFSYENFIGQGERYLAGKAMESVAHKSGMSLQELNLLLYMNSRLGIEVAGSTFSYDDQTVGGFFTREGKGSALGGIWDVNDTLLNAQGLLDAVSREVVTSGYKGHLTGHSLGAARVNNLYSQGLISGATTMSLPAFAYPAKGSVSYCVSTDPICGGALLTPLRAGVQPLKAPDKLLQSHDWAVYKEATK